SFALESDGALDDELRARVLAAYANELAFTARLPERLRLSDEAVAVARASGRPALLLNTLNHRFNAIATPETLEARRRDAAEAIRLADAAGNPRARVVAAGWAMAAAVEEGDRDAVDHHLAGFTSLAEEVGLPVFMWGARAHLSWRHVLAGRLEEAEEAAGQALRFGSDHGRPEAALVYQNQMAGIRWLQGRLDEEAEALARTAEALPAIPGLRALAASALLQGGDKAGARRRLRDGWRDGSILALPHDQMFLAAVMQWGEVA